MATVNNNLPKVIITYPVFTLQPSLTDYYLMRQLTLLAWSSPLSSAQTVIQNWDSNRLMEKKINVDNLEVWRKHIFPSWVPLSLIAVCSGGCFFNLWNDQQCHCKITLSTLPTAWSACTLFLFLLLCWQRQVIYLLIVTNCNRSLSSNILYASLKEKRNKRDKWIQLNACSTVTAVSLLTGIWWLRVQIGIEEKRRTVRGCELSLSVFEWQNVPPPMNTKGNLLPLFITQLF